MKNNEKPFFVSFLNGKRDVPFGARIGKHSLEK